MGCGCCAGERPAETVRRAAQMANCGLVFGRLIRGPIYGDGLRRAGTNVILRDKKKVAGLRHLPDGGTDLIADVQSPASNLHL